MAFGNLTSRQFEGAVLDWFRTQLKLRSKEAKTNPKVRALEVATRYGNLSVNFRPNDRVLITWRDRGGIKEGWYMKNWTVKTAIKRSNELLNS